MDACPRSRAVPLVESIHVRPADASSDPDQEAGRGKVHFQEPFSTRAKRALGTRYQRRD